MSKKFLVSVLALSLSLASTQLLAASRINIDGSSTVYPITEAVAEEFQKENKDVKVLVGISGTGGGFKRFARGETDISGASRPIKSSEILACKEKGIGFIEIPVAYDGLAVMVNKENDFISSLSMAQLKKIWSPAAQNNIKKWNQVSETLPAEKLTLLGPGTASGTFDYFTEAVNGKAGSSRGDYIASEDDNVLVEGISGDKGALGYFGLAYYEENKDSLKLVAVDGGKGPILPSTQTVGDGSYPLSRPLFIYVSASAAKKPHVKKFVEYYLTHAKTLAAEVGYIPFSDDVYTAALERFKKGTTGSIFAGSQSTGIKMQTFMKKK